MVRERTAEEILAPKKKWGTTGDLLEAKQRIEAIAADIVDHDVDNILPNGFEAQVVCSSKMAAVHYKMHIDQALARRLAEEQAKPVRPGDPGDVTEPELAGCRDDDLCKRIAFLKSAVVVSSEGTNERAAVTKARKHAQEGDALENFKRRFDYDDPEKANTGIAFLIVCDMLLTGFDAPVEQVMYIDKPVKHNATFWIEVDKVMPGFRERKEWLRVNGAGMDLQPVATGRINPLHPALPCLWALRSTRCLTQPPDRCRNS